MKTLRIFALMACLSGMVFLAQAQAAFLSVSPTGSFDAVAQGVSSITYDVFFNVVPADGSLTFISWDFDMQYDTTELANPVASNVQAGDILVAPGTLNNLFFSLDPATDVTFSTPGVYQLASVTFDILTPVQVFDGMADFSVVSQIGSPIKGFTTDLAFLQLPGANGADVGTQGPSPVPIPGAVWVLASGLAGLVGLRRTTRS